VEDRSVRDFASFLDDVPGPRAGPVSPEERLDDGAGAPSIPFGFVAGAAAHPAGDGPPEFLATYLGLNAGQAADVALPETAPDAIARELGLHRVADLKSLDRLRREFAFGNHPDRVRPEWRDRAMARMQTANRLIDEAKQRLAGRRG
jgi:hypothetical protein